MLGLMTLFGLFFFFLSNKSYPVVYFEGPGLILNGLMTSSRKNYFFLGEGLNLPWDRCLYFMFFLSSIILFGSRYSCGVRYSVITNGWG